MTAADHETERGMPALIRPASDGDLDALVGLSLLAWAPVFASFRQVLGQELFARIYPDWRAQQRATVETICGPGGRATVLVAEVAGAGAGFLAYTVQPEGRTGEVALLAVHPDHQNRGIGTALNRVALERMRAGGVALASVGTGGDPGHAPARRAYEKAGYTALPTVRYYQQIQEPPGR
jgi:GNAT superfamily N-acetyltransferase